METCSLPTKLRQSGRTGNLECWLQEVWESGMGMYLDGRKQCFNQLGVPTGPGREHRQESNREGQVGHLGHSQLIK